MIKVSPLQDNFLKVGNDALKLNISPAVIREAAFMSDDDRVQSLADTYEKMYNKREPSAPNNKKPEPDKHKPPKIPRM